MSDARVAELSANLDAVRRRIAAACTAAGRHTDDVQLVAVSKTWPASDVLALRSLGVTDFGESYDQEAKAKAASLAAMGLSPRWHFVGRLQRNKCASIAGYADVVHAVDRTEVVDALSGGAVRAGRMVDVLVQVSLDGDPQRGGVRPDALPKVADAVAGAKGLSLRGVMAVPPRDASPEAAFLALAEVSQRLQTAHPFATIVSAGMTSDLESAIAAGSTCVRVGTAVFGRRDQVLH